MAPPPEYDKEPKAPDKSTTTITNEDQNIVNSIVTDQQTNSDLKPNQSAADVVEINKVVKSVENLDDGRLRALLDEAMTYKNPKDREGKSALFQVLLEAAEADNKEKEAKARAEEAMEGRPNGSASMSNLDMEELKRKTGEAQAVAATGSVASRSLQGGSLPAGFNTPFLQTREASSSVSPAYLATVRCVNPPPLTERRVSLSDAESPEEVELLNRSKSMFPVTYTARATLEIGSGSVGSGRAVTTTTASNQGDSAIPFSCITTPEVVASCNTTSSIQSALAIDPKPRSVISSSFNGLALSRPNYGATCSPDDYKKSLDENGNAVQGISSPNSGSSQHKKPRRKKTSKNEILLTSHQIDGYQGNKDLKELLRFIESNADHGRGKLGRKHKDDSDDKAGKKRSTERRKDKESKLKRASSLEELSRTKLEDLTDAAPPPRRAEPEPKHERRSWGDDARHAFYYREPESGSCAPPPPPPPPLLHAAPAPADPGFELTDFQTVTKRRKPRRRTDEPAPRRPRPPSPRPRRESAPPSDRSNDSNDDLDSVHSLPADAPQRAPVPHPAHPAPPPPAPVSYADIARTRHNIPDLIESCNFYSEGEGGGGGGGGGGRPAPPELTGAEPAGTGAAGDADGYPALGGGGVGGGARPTARLKLPPRRDRKERPLPPAAAECPAPDVVSDRRPPVILLDSAARPRDMDGVTFGFDINEQLLSGPARRPRCDLVRDAVEGGPAGAAGAGAGVAVRAGCAALRYVPPDPPPNSHHLHQIIDYVGSAWEDVVRCGGGKVRYFSE